MPKHTLFALILAASASLALAHSKSETTTPADGAVVSEVPEVLMRFDGPMRIIAVTLSSDSGDVEIARDTGMEPVTVFRATPVQALAPGQYRLDWRGMAADGHPMQGGFAFTVAE